MILLLPTSVTSLDTGNSSFYTTNLHKNVKKNNPFPLTILLCAPAKGSYLSLYLLIYSLWLSPLHCLSASIPDFHHTNHRCPSFLPFSGNPHSSLSSSISVYLLPYMLSSLPRVYPTPPRRSHISWCTLHILICRDPGFLCLKSEILIKPPKPLFLHD